MPQSILLCVSHLRPVIPKRALPESWTFPEVSGLDDRFFFLLSSYREPTALFSCDVCVAVIPPDWAHLESRDWSSQDNPLNTVSGCSQPVRLDQSCTLSAIE